MADMKFDGTHKPGEHTTIAPTPPKIIIPKPKVTTVREIVAWHASRGGAVAAAAAANPVLLPGLIGWELTGVNAPGANQTLSSAGVIASGALNWTASGSPTFDADGCNMLRNSGQYLTLSNKPTLSTIGQSFAGSLLFELTAESPEGSYQLWEKGDPGEADVEIDVVLFNSRGRLKFMVRAGDASYPRILYDAVFALNQKYAVLFAFDKDAALLRLKINDGAWQTTSGVTANTVVMPNTHCGGSFGVASLNADVKFARMWIGNISAPVAAANWLANMSGGVPLGRTDAEVAVYAG